MNSEYMTHRELIREVLWSWVQFKLGIGGCPNTVYDGGYIIHTANGAEAGWDKR